MMHNYRINCSALMQNNLFREVEIMSYVGGKSKIVKTRADIETFCLYDFLIFFSNARNRKIIIKNDIQHTWINYAYLIEKNPTLFLNNAKIKRMLSILEGLDLLSIVNDSGSIYVAPKNLELVMLDNQPVMNHNQPVTNHNQGSVMNHNQGSVMNHNCNNNKESIIKKNNNDSTPYIPQSENECKSENESSPLKAIRENFDKLKELYKQIKPSMNDLLFQRAEQEFFRIARDGVCSAPEIVEAMKKQVELWNYKLKEDAQAVKYIPRLENWLERRAFFEDFENLLKPYKHQNSQRERGTTNYGGDGIQSGNLAEMLASLKNSQK